MNDNGCGMDKDDIKTIISGILDENSEEVKNDPLYQWLSEKTEWFDGSAFCSDRSRHIVRCAIKWRMTGELPVFNPAEKKNFHHPPNGTPAQWMALVEGLGYMRYGKPDKWRRKNERKRHSVDFP